MSSTFDVVVVLVIVLVIVVVFVAATACVAFVQLPLFVQSPWPAAPLSSVASPIYVLVYGNRPARRVCRFVCSTFNSCFSEEPITRCTALLQSRREQKDKKKTVL